MKNIKKIFLGALILTFGVILVACKKDKKIKVTYIVDGNVHLVEEYNKDSYAKRPTDPTKEGFEFDGWYKSEDYFDDNKYIFSDEKLTKDVNIYGRFVNEDTQDEFPVNIQLPVAETLKDAENIKKVEDAPDLLIIGVVVDTFYYFHHETMSGYEYIKVFNNTNEPYNLKDHRIVIANPIQGVNGESDEAKIGNRVLATGYLYNSYIDEDFIIDPLDIALIWLKPYYWTIGSGTNAYNKPFTADVVHATTAGKKGAFDQTMDDFKQFWDLDDTIKVYESTNMPMIAKRAEAGTSEFFPMITPAGGNPYTHLNASLLRSIEIQKFNNQGGTAKVEVLNKYSELSDEEKQNPKEIFGKQAFNTFHITDNDETVDIYQEFSNAWKYFDPIVRAQIHGLVDETQLVGSDHRVDFTKVDSPENPGIKRWDNTVEIQYRVPEVGERVMQMQLPLREARKFSQYVSEEQMAVIRVSTEEVSDYRWREVTVLLSVNPELTEINWRRDEVKSPGRMSAAAPSKIKAINLTRPSK